MAMMIMMVMADRRTSGTTNPTTNRIYANENTVAYVVLVWLGGAIHRAPD